MQTVNDILEKELLDYGFTLEDDEDCVDLKHNDKIIATWYSSAATAKAIRLTAWSWMKRQKGEDGSK